ncbi:uncharacterized protein PRCAT00004213001 [Priceomyces carsonii]|uniref:uncharacterized protein n=1 Tax=Priceomyces carsonii TaxID=28549 RepID=UPI002ED92C6B|nr:unnamed protein product [Priceomyces carsonii]
MLRCMAGRLQILNRRLATPNIPLLRGMSQTVVRKTIGSTQNGSSTPVKQTTFPDLTAMKLDSNGSKDLYAVFKLHNIPFLVSKGDKVVLPYKLKNVEVGDLLVLKQITTLGSPEITYNDENGISDELYEINANVVEITREPYYEVYRKKQRCRRKKTFPVQNFQTILRISELRLK